MRFFESSASTAITSLHMASELNSGPLKNWLKMSSAWSKAIAFTLNLYVVCSMPTVDAARS